MNQEQLCAQLKELAFSADLSDEAIGQIAESSSVIEHAAGTILFREGSIHQALLLICSGAVALEMCVPARGCVRLLTLGSGDMVSWSALLGRGEMTATAIVTQDARMIAISASRLLEICRSNHEVGYQIMQRMAQALSRRLLATRLQLLDLFSAEPPAITSSTAER